MTFTSVFEAATLSMLRPRSRVSQMRTVPSTEQEASTCAGQV